MLVHRLRRWPNIDPTLGECPVISGRLPHYKHINRSIVCCIFSQAHPIKRYVDPMPAYCWAGVADGGPTICQHSVNVCLMG